jgi:hypothetical protein
MDRADQLRILEMVLNDPEVRPGVAPGFGHIAAGTFFDIPGNIMIGDERGILLFHSIGNGVVEGHYLLTNALRGSARIKHIRAGIAELFTLHDAWAIEGNTPRAMQHARCMNRALGFRPTGISVVDSSGRDCIKYILERKTWARLSAPA